MSISKLIGGALAASLAVAAQAQVVWPPQKANPRQPQPTQQPGQQPQTAPAPAPQGQAQPGQPLSQEQLAALGTMRQHNSIAMRVAEMGATRGSSNEVKNLGRLIQNDAKRVEGEINTLVKERGVDWNQLAAPPSDQKFEEEIGQLASRSGDEFDKEFIAFLTRNGTRFVDALKKARDVTPGKDSKLKKSLDDMENLEEAHLSAARQLKSQRQARTPPKR